MLIERRAFSLASGTITSLIDQVLDVPRDDEVVIIFNGLVIPVMPDDDHHTVRGRWLETRAGRPTVER